MKAYFPLQIISLAAPLLLTALACPTTLPGLASPIFPSDIFTVKNNEKISSNYSGTRCVDFYIVTINKKAGFLCSSSDPDFLMDFGITTGAVNEDQSQYSDIKVSTAITSYDMMPVQLDSRILYASEVDCDEGSDPTYRATSTCHIAVMPLNNGRFLYSNFVLKNHVRAELGIETRDILSIWKDLKIHREPNGI